MGVGYAAVVCTVVLGLIPFASISIFYPASFILFMVPVHLFSFSVSLSKAPPLLACGIPATCVALLYSLAPQLSTGKNRQRSSEKSCAMVDFAVMYCLASRDGTAVFHLQRKSFASASALTAVLSALTPAAPARTLAPALPIALIVPLCIYTCLLSLSVASKNAARTLARRSLRYW
jgi:hypothetical protein